MFIKIMVLPFKVISYTSDSEVVKRAQWTCWGIIARGFKACSQLAWRQVNKHCERVCVGNSLQCADLERSGGGSATSVACPVKYSDF